MKIKTKIVTAEQFLRRCNKFKCYKPTLESIKKLKEGSFLARIINKEKLIITDYYLKKIYIRKFDFPYSCHQKIRKGKELLISNMYLPPVKF